MRVDQERFDLSESELDGVDAFDEWIWRNTEVCNSCFQQVRSVGPKVTKTLQEPDSKLLENGRPVRMEINQWFERTERGSQEHNSFDLPSDRFGSCFCLDCGTDCTGDHRHKTIDELKPLAANIYRFATTQSPLELDHETFGKEIKSLKKVPEYQGYETEILAIAFSRALE